METIISISMQYLIWKYWNRIVHSLCRSETCIRPRNKYNMTIDKHLYIPRRKLFYENRWLDINHEIYQQKLLQLISTKHCFCIRFLHVDGKHYLKIMVSKSNQLLLYYTKFTKMYLKAKTQKIIIPVIYLNISRYSTVYS